jgi:transcriptional regulator with XRE-family HTH domain
MFHENNAVSLDTINAGLPIEHQENEEREMLSETLTVGLEHYRIGPKIRALRLKKKLGLVQLGEHTGLSPAMLSKIERGQLFPTLPTLLRIALVFGVGLEHFFLEEERPAVAVVRKNERLRLPDLSGEAAPAYFFESLDFPATDRRMESFYAEFPVRSKPSTAARARVGGIHLRHRGPAGRHRRGHRSCPRRRRRDVLRFERAARLPAREPLDVRRPRRGGAVAEPCATVAPAATGGGCAMRMVKWLFLALVLAAPAHAQTPDPSLRYRVVDVAADDKLNVREQPGVDAAVIGAFAPHADDIVITGAIMEVEGSDWWEVGFVDGYLDRGWVNGRFLEPVDRQARDSDYPLQCSGTEPFWSLALDEGQATYSSPDRRSRR